VVLGDVNPWRWPEGQISWPQDCPALALTLWPWPWMLWPFISLTANKPKMQKYNTVHHIYNVLAKLISAVLSLF